VRVSLLTLLLFLSRCRRDQFSSAAKPPYSVAQIFPMLARIYLANSGQRSSFGKRKIMMRAALILVGLSTLAIMELETAPRTTKAAGEPLAPSTTVGMSDSRGTLTKTDRLEIPFLQYNALAQPSSFGVIAQPDMTPIVPQRVPNITNQHKPGANEKKIVVVKPKPRPKPQESKKAAKTDRPMATTEIKIKPCRPNAFDGLLRALDLSPGCET
jgi:outer membrane biosynthesis protein TonB